MAFHVTLTTPRTLPGQEDSPLLTDPFHKSFFALVDELKRIITDNQVHLHLGKHQTSEKISIAIIQAHHKSQMADIRVELNCGYVGGGDGKKKAADKRLKKVIEEFLDGCSMESYSVEAVIYRGNIKSPQ